MKLAPGKRASCPRCRQRLAPDTELPAFPFCSERCKLIDLGSWFDESYKLGDTPGLRDPLNPGGSTG
jgi:endogenous inhibitor of DNA gyrase (YacG/DUF329 family)